MRRRVVPKFIGPATTNLASFSQLPCDSITSNQGHVTCQAKRPPLETMLDEIGGLVEAVEHSEEKVRCLITPEELSVKMLFITVLG